MYHGPHHVIYPAIFNGRVDSEYESSLPGRTQTVRRGPALSESDRCLSHVRDGSPGSHSGAQIRPGIRTAPGRPDPGIRLVGAAESRAGGSRRHGTVLPVPRGQRHGLGQGGPASEARPGAAEGQARDA